ncbi:MAG: hypothetical protein R3297_08090 [Desulfobulbales bacterium]|nr:hypothetical protein [Desulfobulbales bacterium]
MSQNRILIHFFLYILTSSFILSLPRHALAVQAHGGAEGLVSHQIGHIMFIAGMGYLLYRIVSNRIEGPGWSEFKLFLVTILLWNFLTFTGHWLHEVVDASKFMSRNGVTVAYKPGGFTDYYYYLTRLDHLVLVPSFVFLLLALKKWSQPS